MWQSLLLSTADPSHTFAPDNSELRHIRGPCRAPSAVCNATDHDVREVVVQVG